MKLINWIIFTLTLVTACGYAFAQSSTTLPTTSPSTTANFYKMHLTPGGALVLDTGGQTFFIDSLFSEPGTPKGTWNTFSDSLPKSKDWTVTIEQGNSEALHVTGKGKFYQIERTYLRKKNYVEVADKITITHDSAVGIHLRHRLKLSPEQSSNKILIGGLDVTKGAGLCGSGNLGNPTLFVKTNAAAIGLLLLDDVFRVQGEMVNYAIAGPVPCKATNPPTVELIDRNFGLEGGRSYTIRWAIYSFEKDTDYFTFINMARKDIDANFTILGNAIFFYPHSTHLNRAGYEGDWRKWNAETLRQFLKDQGIRYVMSGIPTKANDQYAHGPAFVHELGPTSAEFLRDLVKKVHEADPSVKVLVYLNQFLSTESDAQTKYPKDRITDKDGKQISSPYSYPVLGFYGTKKNKYGKDLERYVNKVMNEFKADGIFIDESPYSVSRLNYDGNWDGFSVVLDPVTFQIQRKIAYVTLMTLPLRIALVHKVKQAGGSVIANVPPLTQTMANEKIVHFTETGALSHLSRTHLHSPVGLNKGDSSGDPDPNVTIGNDAAKNFVAHLDYGTLSYFYGRPYPKGVTPNPSQQMFPLTPIELHEGYVIGEERILTARSGIFGWNTPDKLHIFIYGTNGQQKSREIVTPKNGSTSVAVNINPGEIAIIVKEQFVNP